MLLKLFLKYGKASFFSRQLEKPSGLFGKWITARMLDQGNEKLHNYCIALMDVKENNEILELGFGTGAVIEKIGKLVFNGRISGIDFSPEMVELARQRNKILLEEGRADIREGNISQLPFSDASFDKIYTANTIYFWKNPLSTAGEVLRVLKPGGKLFIAFRPKHIIEKLPVVDSRFTLYTEDAIKELFIKAGSKSVEIFSRKESDGLDSYCAVVDK